MTQIDLSKAVFGEKYLTRNGQTVTLIDIAGDNAYPYRFRPNPRKGCTFTTTVNGTYYKGETLYHPYDIVSRLHDGGVAGKSEASPVVEIGAIQPATARLEHWIERAIRAEVALTRRMTAAGPAESPNAKPVVNLLSIADIGVVHGKQEVLDMLQARLERARELENKADYVENLRQSMKGTYGKLGGPASLASSEGNFLDAPTGWYLSQLRHNHHRPAYHKIKVPYGGPDGPWIAAFRSLVGIKRVCARGRTANEALARARAKAMTTRLDPYQECNGNFFD